MAGIFKAYDIRGIVGESLNDDIAFKIGRAFATLLKPKTVTVGHDMRPHSMPLFKELARGLTLHGVDVVDLGLCTTPMSNYGNGTLKADAGIMITASHNPGEWNGMKLSRAQAVPISGDTGIADIEAIVNNEAFDAPAASPGTVTSHPIAEAYMESIRQHANVKRPIRIAVDMANGMGIVESGVFEGILDVDPLFDTLDGTFPNHEANPLKEETYEALQAKMRADGNYDFGVSFDGDADRAGFTDENGTIIPMDMITALIAIDVLSRTQGVVLYDLRSSKAVQEIIEENGGIPRMCRVGHAFIKQQMRDEDAVFAGELSGHYYFRDNFYTESSALAVISVANIIAAAGKPLSELIAPLQRYAVSGEINSEVESPEKVLDTIRTTFADGKQFELDGVSVVYDDWWFNVRMSNTEPLVRLNLEATSADIMVEKRDALLKLIRGEA